MSSEPLADTYFGGAPTRAVLARVIETRNETYPENRVLLASRAENRGTTSQRLTAIAARCVYPGWLDYPFVRPSRA